MGPFFNEKICCVPFKSKTNRTPFPFFFVFFFFLSEIFSLWFLIFFFYLFNVYILQILPILGLWEIVVQKKNLNIYIFFFLFHFVNNFFEIIQVITEHKIAQKGKVTTA